MRLRSLLLLAAFACAGCFAPDHPVCSFRCDNSVGNGGRCPADYECRLDGYCHLKGSTGACPFSALPDLRGGGDAATDGGTDGSAGDGGADDGGTADGGEDLMTLPDGAEDLSAAPDLATPDLATPDLATPDLATPDLANTD